MKLNAASRPHGNTHAEQHHWTVEAPTYAEARAAVPEGCDLLSVQVDRD